MLNLVFYIAVVFFVIIGANEGIVKKKITIVYLG